MEFLLPKGDRIAVGAGTDLQTRTSDVIDASVVILAKQRGDAIVTSDAETVQRLDPTARILSI
jgi:hypothetical protein